MTNSSISACVVMDVLRIQGRELFLVGWFCGKSSVDGNLIRETYARGGWVDNVVFLLHRGQ